MGKNKLILILGSSVLTLLNVAAVAQTQKITLKPTKPVTQKLNLVKAPPPILLYISSAANSNAVDLMDRDSEKVGQVDSGDLLRLNVSESVLKQMMPGDEVNLDKLSELLTPNENGLVEARVELDSRLGKRQPLGRHQKVYFHIDRLKDGNLVASGAKSISRQTNRTAEEFNQKLSKKNVAISHTHKRDGHPKVGVDHSRKSEAAEFSLGPPTCGCLGRNCTITSGFGLRKAVKTSQGWSSSNHSGLDIASGEGTPIIATGDSCISKKLTNKNGSFGFTLFLEHLGDPTGFESQYSHMSRFVSPQPKIGDCFSKGQLIGYMGQTGNCTGSHLHYTLRKNERVIDPLPFLEASRNARTLSEVCPKNVASLPPRSKMTVATTKPTQTIRLSKAPASEPRLKTR